MRRWLLASISAALLGCDLVYDVHLELVDAGGLPAGFDCKDNDAGVYLAQKLVSQGRATIILDVLDFGTDLIPCTNSSIVAQCTGAGCPLRSRACFPVQIDPTNGSSVADVQQVLDSLHAEDAGLSGLPSDRNIMVRMIGTNEDPAIACAQDGGAYDEIDASTVFGCAFTCPIPLSTSGTDDLLLDTLGANCVGIVCACATLEHFNAPACGL
jgi:hypothetical protein